MTEAYWKPNEIRFTREQIEWLIPALPLLRNGTYPRDPKETGVYDTPIGKRQVKAKAGFITAAEIASELDWRITQTGEIGIFLELVYSQPDDKIFILQHISVAIGVDIDRLDRDIERAMHYIVGFKRRQRSYKEWRQHRRQQKEGGGASPPPSRITLRV